MNQKQTTNKKHQKNIDYALVEDSRPALYTSMKYWGKKPHNIWRSYIENYTSESGVYLDVFSGSGMSAFEAYKAGRKAIALDLNPLTSFVIKTVSGYFDKPSFIKSTETIINSIKEDKLYNKLFQYKSGYILQNAKWNNEKIYEVCFESLDGKKRICKEPDENDIRIAKLAKKSDIHGLYPNKKFRKSSSYSDSFLKEVGTRYSDLYTTRNLYVLSKIFNMIVEIKNDNTRNALLFAFIQTVHLSTKMCVPRSKNSNRDFSTSWGRPAFLNSKKQMEMNPLLLFQSSALRKQSALSSLEFAKKYFEIMPKIQDVDIDFSLHSDIDIWYGVKDAKTIDDFIPEKSIDFILTDPPYGGLIQYLDLSSIWLSWLELIDHKYSPSYENELTVNEEKDYESFESDFTTILSKLKRVLKDDGKLVLTFNNKNIKTWAVFLNSIRNAGFEIEKVIFQYNKRTGESNVSNPYGSSASDFYIRCIKSNKKGFSMISSFETENLIVEKAKEILEERKEPTPYLILFNGILAKLATSNVDMSSFNEDAGKILQKYNGIIFCTFNNTKKAGDYWWFKDKKYNSNSKNTLTNKLRRFIKGCYNIDPNISYSEILQKIYIHFQNGMTPDLQSIKIMIDEYKIKT